MEGQGSERRNRPQGSKRGRAKPRRAKGPKHSESAATERCSNSPLPHDGAVSFQALIEDITCSVCLDDLQNPVSIACGHSFCHDCITKHWATPQPGGFLCPECRAPCPRRQIAPDYRLMSLISKIQMGAQEKSTKKEGSPFPDRGHPVQLVWTGDNGSLCFDESTVYNCFMSSEICDYPVYLLSIIGEKRQGKSFLMNYIMRALESQERGEEFSLGADSDPLRGFKWRSGIDSTTKGILIWSRPFILGQKGEKVAVYLLDTEGSLDTEGDRESCIKLSALSMMLSSHLIFNVVGSLKETEMDYMEMYLHMGDMDFSHRRLQYLDILIRDWYDFAKCGQDEARSYINQEIQKLRKGARYPKVLWGLQNSNTRCFLFPHPGKGITGDSLGRLEDMDEDFQASLRTYVEKVVSEVSQRIKTDLSGNTMTCSHIPSMLMELVNIFEKQKYGFSTPMEMYHAIKNQKTLEDMKNEMRVFLDNQHICHLPSTMKTLVSDKSAAIMAKFKDSLLGLKHREELLLELETHLKETKEKFCSSYTTRFMCGAGAIGVVTAGASVYGVVGAVAARGAVAVAAQPVVAVGGSTLAMDVAAGAVSLLKTGATVLMGRFFR